MAEILEVSISDPERIDSTIAKSKVLRDFVNYKYQVSELNKKLDAIVDQANEEFKTLFDGIKQVSGAKVRLTLPSGKTTWVYSQALEEKKKAIKAKEKEEKKAGTAKANVGVSKLKVEFINNKKEK